MSSSQSGPIIICFPFEDLIINFLSFFLSILSMEGWILAWSYWKARSYKKKKEKIKNIGMLFRKNPKIKEV